METFGENRLDECVTACSLVSEAGAFANLIEVAACSAFVACACVALSSDEEDFGIAPVVDVEV